MAHVNHHSSLFVACLLSFGCGGQQDADPSTSAHAGNAGTSKSPSKTGGTSAVPKGGAPATGGSSLRSSQSAVVNGGSSTLTTTKPSTGGSSTGGPRTSGGTSNLGGTSAKGGSSSSGGSSFKSSGGTSNLGGTSVKGGSSNTGGIAIGGTTSSVGGTVMTGGTSTQQGGTSNGGTSTSTAAGGAPGGAGGTLSAGGSAPSGGWTVKASSLGIAGSAGVAGASSTPKSHCQPPTRELYVTGPNYSGYAFGFVSHSKTYGDITNCDVTGVDQLCLSGTVAANENSPDGLSVVGALGINLNQAAVPAAVANPLSWTIGSITLGFTNTFSNSLRVQINQGDLYHCYDLRGLTSPATLDVSQFSDNCWESSPIPLGASAGQGIIGIQLVVPSSSNQSLDFDVCLTSLTID